MRRRILAAAAGCAVVGVATPAVAASVEIRNEGGCRTVYVSDKRVTLYSICYLGPPPPSITH